MPAKRLFIMKPDVILFFDTETTGVNTKRDRIVELAWVLCDNEGKIIREETRLIIPEGFEIPVEASAIHGITTEIATVEGEFLSDVLNEFLSDMRLACLIVGHNIMYDIEMIKNECIRKNFMVFDFLKKSKFCTMRNTVDYCKLSQRNGRTGYKYPKLSEAYQIITGSYLVDCHDALADTEACKEIFFTGLENKIFQFNEEHPLVVCEVCR